LIKFENYIFVNDHENMNFNPNNQEIDGL